MVIRQLVEQPDAPAYGPGGTRHIARGPKGFYGAICLFLVAAQGETRQDEAIAVQNRVVVGLARQQCVGLCQRLEKRLVGTATIAPPERNDPLDAVGPEGPGAASQPCGGIGCFLCRFELTVAEQGEG
jgi:hypothetical protein